MRMCGPFHTPVAALQLAVQCGIIGSPLNGRFVVQAR